MADEGCSDADEGEEVLGLSFVATVQASTAGQPGNGPLYHPAMVSEPLGRLDALAGNAMADAPLTEPFPQVVVVVALVGVELGGASAPWTTVGADGRDPAHERLQAQTVVQVGAGDSQRQGQSASVRDEVDLRSQLATVGRIWSGQWPPFAARTLTESIAHRDQSNSPRLPSSSSTTRWSLAQTRSWLHRAKRR